MKLDIGPKRWDEMTFFEREQSQREWLKAAVEQARAQMLKHWQAQREKQAPHV